VQLGLERRGIALLLFTIVTGACRPSSVTSTPTVGTPPVPVPVVSPVSSGTTLPGSNESPDPQPAVTNALRDAASHLNVGEDQLHVDQVEPRQWPDSALGCPQPGIMYSQIVTPGFLIIISTRNGKRLEYHANARGDVRLCEET
jgi:hypothetical protein